MKLLNNLKSKLSQLTVKARTAYAATINTVTDTEGASEHTDKSVWIIGGIVLGVLIITALGIMFKDTLIPAIQTAISNIFSIKF